MITEPLMKQITSQGISRDLLDTLFDAVFFVDHERKVIHWNRAAERLTGHPHDGIVGKSCCEDILLHINVEEDEAGSGFHPAADTLADGQGRESEAFLRHRSGHLVPVRARVTPVRDEDDQVVGVLEVLTEIAGSAGTLLNGQQLRDLAFIDPQTNLSSRRYLEMRLLARFEEMQRYGWSFGVIMACIDNLDAIREDNGQDVADAVVERVAKTFANALRSFDTIGRWEDDEFLAIVPVLEYSHLYAIGDRIRHLVEKVCVSDNPEEHPTISVGAASPEEADSIVDVVKRARSWMDQAHQTGGNRTAY